MRSLKYFIFSLFTFAIPVSSASAAVSFTFDDGYVSILDNGFPVLDQYHLKGTVYIITGIIGKDNQYMNWGDIDLLHKKGWTIGSHTRYHSDFSKIPLDAVKAEVEDSAADLRYHDLVPTHFAPPYGEFTDEQLTVIRSIYSSNRMGWYNNGTGLNNARHLDRNHIQVVPLNQETNLRTVRQMIRAAAHRNVWLVFMIHRVVLEPTGGKWEISKSKLKGVVEYTVRHHVRVVTLDQYLGSGK